MKEIKSQTVAKVGVPNKNNTVYPRSILNKIVSDFNEKETQDLLGQLGMPDDGRVHFSKVSHAVRELRMSGDKLVADIEIMDTPCGKQLVDLIESGMIAFRLQGVGSTHLKGIVKVVDDGYKMISINAVSTENAS